MYSSSFAPYFLLLLVFSLLLNYSINSHCFSLGVLVVKKSLLLIKALIIVVWSAQVSLAQQEATSLTSDIFGYFLVFLWLLPLILQVLIIFFLATFLSVLITSPLLWICERKIEDKKLSSILRIPYYLLNPLVYFITIILDLYLTYKISVWWFDLYSFESWVKLCWRTGNC